MIRLLLLVLLVAGAGLLLVSRHNAHAAEAQFADVAAKIARREVSVHCQGVVSQALDVGAEAGSVQFDASGRPSDTAELKRGVCAALRSFAGDVGDPEFECVVRDRRCPRDVLRSMWAVHTLAHEAWHLAGEKNEAVTECYALQTTAWASERLGASPLEGQAIARYVTAHMYPDMPAAYKSSDCRNDGQLDLRPESTVWP